MERIIPIKLSGHDEPYQMEESAYQQLERYMNESRSRLSGDPDQEEVLGDLERSIGDKLAEFREGGKRELGMDEVEAVLAEMGAVDSGSGPALVAPNQAPPGKRRLYRIREGQWIAGVCTGLAAYGDYRVDWVRTIFLVLAAVTGGAFILVYLVMMFALPVVPTVADYKALGEFPAGAG
jgi:phage shock protein PspC (stress-responsive transcriptional regulator)